LANGGISRTNGGGSFASGSCHGYANNDAQHAKATEWAVEMLVPGGRK